MRTTAATLIIGLTTVIACNAANHNSGDNMSTPANYNYPPSTINKPHQIHRGSQSNQTQTPPSQEANNDPDPTYYCPAAADIETTSNHINYTNPNTGANWFMTTGTTISGLSSLNFRSIFTKDDGTVFYCKYKNDSGVYVILIPTLSTLPNQGVLDITVDKSTCTPDQFGINNCRYCHENSSDQCPLPYTPQN